MTPWDRRSFPVLGPGHGTACLALRHLTIDHVAAGRPRCATMWPRTETGTHTAACGCSALCRRAVPKCPSDRGVWVWGPVRRRPVRVHDQTAWPMPPACARTTGTCAGAWSPACHWSHAGMPPRRPCGTCAGARSPACHCSAVEGGGGGGLNRGSPAHAFASRAHNPKPLTQAPTL